ncbi:annexin-like protein RJ4 [Camellia sinensis]|uniref:annexin-like protein RJ4 n=1 Tax=Camellia sinensis TaxID=4442 RepID=UPI001036A385|nr:annexin-like protein RJ4 [Camellia sinensis]
MATLIVHENSSPVADAEAIRKAVKGFGTNEKAIIKIIGHRNAIQRRQLRQAYEESYQDDLIKRFVSELTGNFEVI